MKKLLSAVVLSAAVVASAGQAHAFGQGSLTLGLYDPLKNIEFGLDLGNIQIGQYGESVLDLTSSKTLGYVTNYAADAEAAGAVVKNLRLGMFLDAGVKDSYFITRTTQSTAPNSPIFNTMNNFDSGAQMIGIKYNTMDGTGANQDGFGKILGAAAMGNYHWLGQMDSQGVGAYRGMNNPSTYGGATIGQVNMVDGVAGASANDFVDFYLWHFKSTNNQSGTLQPGTFAGGSSAVIRFYSLDGKVELNPVPIPAAAWLLGSGLLGMFGLRRKNS